jgi:hypothetical protein
MGKSFRSSGIGRVGSKMMGSFKRKSKSLKKIQEKIEDIDIVTYISK